MATIIIPSGVQAEVVPATGRAFTDAEINRIVGFTGGERLVPARGKGYRVLHLSDNRKMLVNDSPDAIRLPLNPVATRLADTHGGVPLVRVGKQTLRTRPPITGNVLVCYAEGEEFVP